MTPKAKAKKLDRHYKLLAKDGVKRPKSREENQLLARQAHIKIT